MRVKDLEIKYFIRCDIQFSLSYSLSEYWYVPTQALRIILSTSKINKLGLFSQAK